MQFGDSTRTHVATGGAGVTCGNSKRKGIEFVREICRLIDAQVPRPDALHRESQITFVEDRSGFGRRYAIDATKVRGAQTGRNCGERSGQRQ